MSDDQEQRDRHDRPDQPPRPERAKEGATPPPGSTITTGGHIAETRTDHVDPEVAGGPDRGTPH